jgi:3'-5' exoribonuclease
MIVKQILKSISNVIVEGTYVINDIKLKPFTEREGYFLTFSLQDNTGVVWAKIWDNGEAIAEQLKQQNAFVVSIKGRTNVYNNKTQLIVDKIKLAETYELKNLIVVSTKDPEEMWVDLSATMDTIKNKHIKKIWQDYKEDIEFVKKFKVCPGGKGIVHHAYMSGLLEHTLTVLQILVKIQSLIKEKINYDKLLIGGFVHDHGKLDSYSTNNIRIEMTDVGRLHGHLSLGYFMFRTRLENKNFSQALIEDIGHMILSHHGTKEKGAVVEPMTIEAKLISYADNLDSDINYMSQQLGHNSNEQGWAFDSLMGQFLYARP